MPGTERLIDDLDSGVDDMACQRIEQLIRLHKEAQRHSNEYKRLLGDRSARSKALRHLRKAERLFCEVSGLIRDMKLPAELISGTFRFPG
jgi:hypothetical protein